MLKYFILSILLLGTIFANTITTTLQWPDKAYFNFASNEVVSYDEYLASNPTQDPSEIFDIALEPWDEPAWCANRIDMGNVALSSLTIPPTSGYSDDILGFADCGYVEEGHTYWIKTRDGNMAYAKVKVTEAVHIGVDDTYGNINKIGLLHNSDLVLT